MLAPPLLPIVIIDATAVRLPEWGDAYYAVLHPSPRLTGLTTPGAPTRILSRLLLPPAQHEDEVSDYDDRCVSSSVVINDGKMTTMMTRRRSHPTPLVILSVF